MSYSVITLWDVTQKPGAPNILALTPESAASVAIIGTARDLGMCGVVKRDGKPCGSWFDKRVSDVCEYHVQHAVQRCRAGRPEFSAGCVFIFLHFFFPLTYLKLYTRGGIKKTTYRTSGMGVGSGSHKRKAAYDPQRKWGLQPANGSVGSPSSSQLEGGEGPTYVVAGHIVAGGAAGKHDMFLKEKVGREAQARAARRTNSRDTDVALKRLLVRDKEGMRAVQEARKFAVKAKAREKQQIANGKQVGKEVEEGDTGDSYSENSGNDDEEDDALTDRPRSTTKNAYSARVIKELGFDPTVKSLRGSHGRRREEGDEEEPEGSRNEIYSKVLSVSSLSIIKQLRWCSFMQFFLFFFFHRASSCGSLLRVVSLTGLGWARGLVDVCDRSSLPRRENSSSQQGPIQKDTAVWWTWMRSAAATKSLRVEHPQKHANDIYYFCPHLILYPVRCGSSWSSLSGITVLD